MMSKVCPKLGRCSPLAGPNQKSEVRYAVKKYINLKKTIIVLSTSVALLFTAGPAGARWDELIDPSALYGGPPVLEEKTEIFSPRGIYRVEKGDTLSGIASKFGLSVSRLAAVNGLSDRDRIFAGQVLRLPVAVLTHRVSEGETLSEIAGRYGTDMEAIARCNNIENSNLIFAGMQITIPVAGDRPRAVARSLPVGELPWPVTGWISSPFGIRDGRPHEGLDIAAGAGEPIKAVRGGRVIFAGPRGTYGLTVILDHGNGLTTLYAHCSRLLVREGDGVTAGQIIAEVGSTGRSTGPHLHLEVRLDGIPYDPVLCLKRIYA